MLEASCEVNATLTNTKYDGDFIVDTKFTQSEVNKWNKSRTIIIS